MTAEPILRSANLNGRTVTATPQQWEEFRLEQLALRQAAIDAQIAEVKAERDAAIASWTDEDESDITDFPRLSDLITDWDPIKDAFTVERLLRPGYRLLLAAYEGVGKTYVAIQMGLHFAYPDKAGPVFGEFAVNEPLTVLYVDGEVGTGEFVRRANALAGELGVDLTDSEFFRVLTLDDRALHLRNASDLKFIAKCVDKAHEATGRKVVLVLDSTDSLYGKTLWGTEGQEYDDAIKWLQEGRRDWFMTVTAVHTVKKPRETKATYKVDLQDVLGNITRQADAVIVLDQKDDLILRMDVFKRPGRSKGLLQRDDGKTAWRWTKELGEEGRDAWKVPPKDVLMRMGDGWWTANALAPVLGVSRNTTDAYLRDLVRTQEVVDRERPGGRVVTEYQRVGND